MTGLTMSTNSFRLFLALALLAAAAGFLSAGVPAPAVVEHIPARFVPNHAFPLLSARIQSAEPVASAKLYFRASGGGDFHYVMMQPTATAGTYEAVLPIPDISTTAVDYFFEVIDQTFEITWTETFHALTTSDPTPATAARGDAAIWIGKTQASMPDAPAGFSTAGVVGYLGGTVAGAESAESSDDDDEEAPPPAIPPTGQAPVSTASSGGGSWGTIGAVGIAVGAGAGAAVLATQEGRGSRPVTIITPLEACFTVNPDPPRIPEGGMIELNASCSDSAEPITSFVWQLGDGRMMEGPTIQTTYDEAGDYNVLLRVENGIGFALARRRIQVLPTSRSGSLAACITTDPFEAAIGVGETIRLDGGCSQPSERIVSYRWSLGDGRTRVGQAVNASYDLPGSYIVELTVGDGASFSTAEVEVRVESGSELTACFDTRLVSGTPLPVAFPVNAPIEFDASCSTGNVVTYSWNFGDGSMSEIGQVREHTYDEPGAFRVTLDVTDGLSTASTSQVLTIEGPSPSGGDNRADLELSFESGVTQVPPGETRSYKVNVVNRGPADVEKATLQWTFSSSLAYTTNDSCDPAMGTDVTVTCSIDLNSGSGSVTLDLTFPSPGAYEIAASVEIVGGSLDDPDENNTVSRIVNVPDTTADLWVVDVSAPSSSRNVPAAMRDMGQPYTATIGNMSGQAVDATVIFVFDPMGDQPPPTFVSVTNASCDPPQSNGTLAIRCFPGELEVGASNQKDVTVTVTFDAGNAAGKYELRTKIESTLVNVGDPNPGNNERDLAGGIDVQGDADLEATDIEDDGMPPMENENTTYTVNLKNNGPDDADSIVTWTFDTGTTVVQAVGCTISMLTVRCEGIPIASGQTDSMDVIVKFTAGPHTVKARIENSDTNVNDMPLTNNMESKDVIVTAALQSPLRTSFTSSMVVGDGNGGSRGRIRVNESSSDVIEDRAPRRHQLQGRTGENRVEAVRLTDGAEGFWHFDFSNSPHFEPGSFSVRTGQVVSRSAYRITFRLTGSAGERIEFQYRLRP